MLTWLVVLSLASAQNLRSQTEPQLRAHAHNDYEHPRPLLDALAQGFCSVEADVFLTRQGLLVAHTPLDLKPERTLKKLYLEPLRARSRTGGGAIYPGGAGFYLLIDVKTDAKDTYAALTKELAQFADILTVWREGKSEIKAVTVVISGNRDVKTMTAQALRYAAIDGRPADLDGEAPAALVPWISTAWGSQFQWNGTGAMPEAERKKLHELVARAHKQNRKVRFWATPEKPEVWKELLDADVDFINSDKLAVLSKFLQENRAAGK